MVRLGKYLGWAWNWSWGFNVELASELALGGTSVLPVAFELGSTSTFAFVFDSTTPSACFTSTSYVTVGVGEAASDCSSAAIVKAMISCVVFVVVAATRYAPF
ncbi:hypothetical protein BJ165DRAFT_1509244 [Panaeolus papilionaceus]|nr:hypothetical protein BJ165DRAFT_1509244 [Panaeolus papilionaceus]